VAIGIGIEFAGVTQEEFDTAHDHINPERAAPTGLLFHASGPIEGGWGVLDFWESQEDFDAFQAQIEQGMAASGLQLQGPPDIKPFPVHEFIHP
jgi:hypothetical protein